MQKIDQLQTGSSASNLQASFGTAPWAGQWTQWWQSRTTGQKLLPLFLLLAFWALHLFLGGFRADHLAVGLIVILYFAGPQARSFYLFFLPFFLYLMIYDSQGYYADLIRGQVRVQEPYLFDRTFFGIETTGGTLLPSQWLQKHTHPVLDVITGISYIAFVPVFLAVALYFRFGLGKTENSGLSTERIKTQSNALMWGMFWLNLLCCSTYYWYPAAPPWYVDLYGLGPAQLNIVPSPAGAQRFDALLGINLFAEFYSRCPNVFGAIPSLHVAVPMLALYSAFKLRSLRFFCLIFFLLISFSAVYLNHHYVLDVLWGSAYALITGFVMDRYYGRRTVRNEL